MSRLKQRVITLALSCAACAVAAAQNSHHLMRFADVSDKQIVFTYEDDLWLVPLEGGAARRITNDPGAEVWAKFSPDGKWIAFTAQYDGGSDVYVMPAEGGKPQRLTYHPSSDRVLGWWPDGQWVLFRSVREYPSRGEEAYRVSINGGMPEKLNVDRAGLTAVSPDGKQIAYNRISREAATWKRHQGGTAQEIWMGSLEKADYRKITDFPGTDNFPMWHGDAIYFTSDRKNDTLNLCKYDVKSGQVTVLTDYKDFDVKYPSIGPKHIIYQYGETLHTYALEGGETKAVPVQIPTDAVRTRPELVKVAPSTGSFGLSPSGVRMVLEARGEILNFPAEDGEPINVTGASASREKNAAWSPNGKHIAFISDKTGEEEIFLVDQKGGDWKQLTKGGKGFRMHLVWSPDSKWLLFSDKFMKLNLVNADSGEITVLDTGDYDDAWERWGIQDYTWSPNSQWIAYTKNEVSMNDSIHLYSLEQKKSFRLTSGDEQSWSPSFDPQGRYLYFLSNRTFSPLMGAIDQSHVFMDMARPYLFVLKADAASPFAPKDSEEEVAADKSDNGDEKADDKDEKKDEKKDEFRIDLDGIQRRILAAPDVEPGNYFRLEAIKDGFVFLKKTEPEFEKYQVVTDKTGGSLTLMKYDLDKKECSEILSGIANYHLSADGKKLVYRAGSAYGILDAGSKGKVGDGKVDLGNIRVVVDRSEEFAQMFNEAWRIQRDWFYDPGMHGVDWQAIRDAYGRFVPFCGNRSDLNYLIGEMIGELNIGHTYVYGGDVESDARRVSTGVLGCVFEKEAGAEFYKIARIIPGTPGDESERSPLDEPGCPIKAGHYLIAIDGQPVKSSEDPFKFLQDKANKVVTITFNDKPSADGARKHRVKTIGGEGGIRYREWVNKNREYVKEKSGGRIGYVHLPDMGEAGLIEFAKAFWPQSHLEGMIIDDRYNGGGFTGEMILDVLERVCWSLSKPREGKVQRGPERVFAGYWNVLINEDTGSNGEMFAEAIKIRKLAPIIGMRTWGGAIGIEPHQDLVDGGTVTPPQFGLYGLNRDWLIEGVGVVPEIEVQNMPGDVIRGKDAQLDAAIDNILKRLAEKPIQLPDPPAYPNKAKRLSK